MDKYTTNPNEDNNLPNKLGLSDQDKIDEEEFLGFTRAAQKAIDALDEHTVFDLAYLYNLHRDALGRVYDFAGRLRTVNMSKEGFSFPAASFLPDNLVEFEEKYLVPLNEVPYDQEDVFLDKLAAMHAELLYLHPFREGNGRVIRLFTKLVYLAKTGKELNLDHLNKGDNFARYIAAVQQAAGGEHTLMQKLFRELHA